MNGTRSHSSGKANRVRRPVKVQENPSVLDSDQEAGKEPRLAQAEENIFLFYPNLIGE
jgi:hypothetical protein